LGYDFGVDHVISQSVAFDNPRCYGPRLAAKIAEGGEGTQLKGKNMPTTIITIDEAGARINELIKLAHQGQEVVITDEGRPTARLVSVPPVNRARDFGKYRGKIKIADDFDAPLPDDFWLRGHPSGRLTSVPIR
jgi:prevent-host-death family protein